MSRATWIRQTTTWTSAFLMTGFGLTSVVSAEQIIRDTGPHSVNTIRTTVENKCKIENTNDISVHNTNDQDAETGKAIVQDNTGIGDRHDFHGPDLVDNIGPAGGGNGIDRILGNAAGGGSGGEATTGDATNRNNTELAINVTNTTPLLEEDNICAPVAISPNFARNKNVRNAAAFNRNSGFGRGAGVSRSVAAPVAIAAPGAPSAPVGGAGGVGQGAGVGVGPRGGVGAGAPGVSEFPSAASANEEFGRGAGAAASSCACASCCASSVGAGSGAGAVISDTGPKSTNTITDTFKNNVTVTNNNTISVHNTNDQTARSGNATVTDNTRAGDAGSGSSQNGNGTGAEISASN